MTKNFEFGSQPYWSPMSHSNIPWDYFGPAYFEGETMSYVPGIITDPRDSIPSDIGTYEPTDDRFYQTRLTPTESPWGYHIGSEPHSPYFVPSEESAEYYPISTGMHTPYFIPQVPAEGEGYYPISQGDPIAPTFGSESIMSEVSHETLLAATVSAAAILGEKLAGPVGTIIGAVIGSFLPKLFHKG